LKTEHYLKLYNRIVTHGKLYSILEANNAIFDLKEFLFNKTLNENEKAQIKMINARNIHENDAIIRKILSR
jgi:hypothetical protein